MPAGQHSLGLMYADGVVVPKDDLAAYIYFYMAAVQSHEGARQKRDEVATRLNAEQLDRGQKLAIYCVESRYTDCPLK
jgi:TPR repeat protein